MTGDPRNAEVNDLLEALGPGHRPDYPCKECGSARWVAVKRRPDPHRAALVLLFQCADCGRTATA